MANDWKKTEDIKPSADGVNPLSQMVSYLEELQKHFEGELLKEQSKLTHLEQELLKAQVQQSRRKGDNRGRP
jgi:hypothetical protein